MRSRFRDFVVALAGAGAMAVFFYAALPLSGQAPAPRIPRLANGKPDLNGLWQAVNTANWDIQAHTRERRSRCGPVRSCRCRPRK